MAQQRVSVATHFGFVQQSAGDDLAANGIDQREQMGPTAIARPGGGGGHPDVDILNTRSPQQGRQTPSGEAVTPAGMEHGMEGVQQDIPRRMRRLTQPGYVVHIHQSERSAGAEQREHLRQECLAAGIVTRTSRSCTRS